MTAVIPEHAEYLGKLRKMADGALASIDRNAVEEPHRNNERQKSWWQGYRQCLDDVEDFLQKHPRGEGTSE